MNRYTSLLPLLLLTACVDQPATVEQEPAEEAVPAAPAPEGEMPSGVQLVPLTGTGIRFDGVYRHENGNLKYYMRFFERGSAAFVGGNEKFPGQLATLLTIDVPSGWNQVHNCPVVQRNDSLYIRSVGLRGVINYYGEVRAAGDSVRFLRESEINGLRQIMAYVFIPDSELQKAP